MANEIEIEIITRLDSVEKSLKNIEQDAKKTGDKVGKSLGSDLKSSLGKSFKSIALAAAGVGAAILSAFAFKKVVEAASIQEDAINKLNQSLSSAGTFSQEASEDIQNFARQLQRTTTTGDETTLSMVALARNFTTTNEQAKNLTAAAIDLSAATGLTLEGSIKNLGKTYAGLTGELGESIPALRNYTVEQLKAGAAIDLVSKRFAGAAASEINTFSGALKQLQNIFGDLLETLGGMKTQSPVFVASIKFISTEIEKLTASIQGASGEDGFGKLIKTGIDIAKFFTSVLGPVFEITSNLIVNLGNRLGALAAAVVQLFSGQFQQAAATFKEGFVNELFNFDQIFDLSATRGAEEFFDRFKTAVDNAAPVAKEFKNNVQDMAKSVGKDLTELSSLVSSTVNNLVSSGVAAIGASLVQGGKAFGNFAKTALNIMGDFAIQLGTMIVAADTAVIALKASLLSFFGGSGIVAGLALIAVGGALKAFAGGPAGAGIATPAIGTEPGAGGGITAGTSAPIGDSVAALQETEERQVGTNVEVNIAGSVLGDKRTLGREIADALNEAFGNDGIVVARGALS